MAIFSNFEHSHGIHLGYDGFGVELETHVLGLHLNSTGQPVYKRQFPVTLRIIENMQHEGRLSICKYEYRRIHVVVTIHWFQVAMWISSKTSRFSTLLELSYQQHLNGLILSTGIQPKKLYVLL